MWWYFRAFISLGCIYYAFFFIITAAQIIPIIVTIAAVMPTMVMLFTEEADGADMFSVGVSSETAQVMT